MTVGIVHYGFLKPLFVTDRNVARLNRDNESTERRNCVLRIYSQVCKLLAVRIKFAQHS
ncbi:hypothetical protein IC229_13630 [Spirosoma sp. BT702]|uniref:Uncharacterized protein n=1 Tax=Spirosoma profusum TaxID=2771354 RepID=A0A926XX73_9BACT|nr:hypothetical protein [Spirosoma profusum]MBD2701686.1 hypothetical protein [Spirosoma profusum]